MKAPEFIETERLILRKPKTEDAEAIYSRYASDPEVTRYLSWSRHRSVEDTRVFIAMSDSAWDEWPGGPYLIEGKESHLLLGGTGFDFETPCRAAVGYVLAKEAWGQGYPTEALQALTSIAPQIGIRRLFACCHAEHTKSARVLEKGGFMREGTLRSYMVFPNLDPSEPMDVLCYARIFE